MSVRTGRVEISSRAAGPTKMQILEQVGTALNNKTVYCTIESVTVKHYLSNKLFFLEKTVKFWNASQRCEIF